MVKNGLIAVLVMMSTPVFAQQIAYIYNDQGVSAEALSQTRRTLHHYLAPKYLIKTINADEIKQGRWSRKTALLIMPGGADLPYLKKLQGAGNEKIKQYIQQGGSYLGLCAGAYYASAVVEFDKGSKLEVLGTRPLQFFKGKAVGPVLAPYNYQNNSGSRAADIRTEYGATQVYYNGGSYFAKAQLFQNTKVIARYHNHLPAIIYIRYGKGHVILSGVHFEYDPQFLNAKDPYLQTIIPKLKNANASRAILIKQVLNLLHV